jgi:hypothetical protein
MDNKLGVIDNNGKALELTENGFKKIDSPAKNNTDNRKLAALLTFLIFAITGLFCLLLDFTGKNAGIFGFITFICAWPAIIVPAIIMGNTSWNKDWKETDWKEANFESDHKYGEYDDGEDDPITGTDYAGSDGNIYS